MYKFVFGVESNGTMEFDFERSTLRSLTHVMGCIYNCPSTCTCSMSEVSTAEARIDTEH